MENCHILFIQNYRNFQRLYRERAGTNYNTTYFGHIAYDCMWTLALALNKTMNMINTNNTLGCGSAPVPLEEFSYGNSTTACLIRDNLENTDFTGLSVSTCTILLLMICLYSKIIL